MSEEKQLHLENEEQDINELLRIRRENSRNCKKRKRSF